MNAVAVSHPLELACINVQGSQGFNDLALEVAERLWHVIRLGHVDSWLGLVLTPSLVAIQAIFHRWLGYTLCIHR